MRAGHWDSSGILISGVTLQHDFDPLTPLGGLKGLYSLLQGKTVCNQGLDVDPLGCEQSDGHRPPAREAESKG